MILNGLFCESAAVWGNPDRYIFPPTRRYTLCVPAISILHALEIIQMAGTTYTELRKRTKVIRPFDIEKSYIDFPREILYQRIDTRVDQMIEAGLEAEARKLEKYRHINALNTVGYKELFDYLDHKYDIPEAIRLIKRNTRHYAKNK